MPDSKHLTLFKTQHQIEGEQIISTSEGNMGGLFSIGEMILTDQRLCFCEDGRKPKFTALLLTDITSMSKMMNMGIMKTITVNTGDKEHTFNLSDKSTFQTICTHLQDLGIAKKGFWETTSPEPISEDSTPESKHVTKFKESHLESDDKVVTSVEGYIGDMMGKGDNTQHNGALIVTSKQVAFYRKGLLGEILETIPLKSITSIERRPTLRHCTIRIHTSHDDLTFKTLDKEQEAIVVKAIEDGRAIEPVSQTAPAPQNGLDTLRELNELKELGIITEEEFNAKKQTILAAI